MAKRIDNNAVITVVSTNHGKTGNAEKVFNALKNGITVAQFKTALARKQLKGYASWALHFALENKLITIKVPA